MITTVNNKRRFINNSTVYNIAATSMRYRVLILRASLSLHNIPVFAYRKKKDTYVQKLQFALYTISYYE